MRESESGNILYNYLKRYFEIEAVVFEKPPCAREILSRRIKRLGMARVTGQILFSLFAIVLKRLSRDRVEEIITEYSLEPSDIDGVDIYRVESANDMKSIELFGSIDADMVIIHGSRILSKEFINAVKSPILNIHAGITPAYRGVHGAYWALANEDPDNCGVSVHLVDSGIDTGAVLYQSVIVPDKRDNLFTYPTLQLAVALPLLKRAIRDICEGRAKSFSPLLPSKLWYHPTIIEYLMNFFLKGVK